MPLRFLKPLFELIYLFGQVAYLIGISTSWFVPGFICGVEGFRQPVLSAAVLIEPTTICGVVGQERFANSLAPCAKLVGTSLLGGPFCGPSPTCLAMLARAASCLFTPRKWEV